jgi:hypothetical protein
MMKPLLVGGLVLLAALAIAPTVTADPVGVTCPDTNPLDDGFAYCYFNVLNTRGCAQVNLGDPNRHCVP